MRLGEIIKGGSESRPPVHRRLRGSNGPSQMQKVWEGRGGDQLTRMLLMDKEAWALPIGFSCVTTKTSREQC